MNKLTVTIGIPVYNAERNIERLVRAVLNQKELGFTFQQLILYSDASSDQSNQIIKGIRSKKITFVDSKERHGMAYGFKHMLKMNKCDAFVLLSDDIVVKDNLLISKLVRCLSEDKKTGLVSGNPRPFAGRNFIERAGVSTFNIYYRTKYFIRNGNNKHTCDGALLVLSSQFIQSLDFPGNDSGMGTVDTFLYFSCIKNKFFYKHVRSAQVGFRYPDNIKDVIKRSTRTNSLKFLLDKQFSNVKQEHAMPTGEYLKSFLIEFAKNPLGCIVIYVIGKYAKGKSKKYADDFQTKWEPVISTKNL